MSPGEDREWIAAQDAARKLGIGRVAFLRIAPGLGIRRRFFGLRRYGWNTKDVDAAMARLMEEQAAQARAAGEPPPKALRTSDEWKEKSRATRTKRLAERRAAFETMLKRKPAQPLPPEPDLPGE